MDGWMMRSRRGDSDRVTCRLTGSSESTSSWMRERSGGATPARLLRTSVAAIEWDQHTLQGRCIGGMSSRKQAIGGSKRTEVTSPVSLTVVISDHHLSR